MSHNFSVHTPNLDTSHTFNSPKDPTPLVYPTLLNYQAILDSFHNHPSQLPQLSTFSLYQGKLPQISPQDTKVPTNFDWLFAIDMDQLFF